MFNVNDMGMIVGDSRVKERRFPAIERSSMALVRGLIIHQTDSEDEFSVFASYARANANGAHFLVAKKWMYLSDGLSFSNNEARR